MCSREEVRVEVEKALAKNNELRNINLENQLGKLSEKIFTHIQKVLKHNKTAPETKQAIEGIKSECVARGTSIALTNQKMADIEKKVDKVDQKLDNLDSKMDAMIDKMDQRYAPMQSWTIMKWAGMIFGAIIIGALAKLIIK